MSGFELLGAVATIGSLVALARRVAASFGKVYENQAFDQHAARRIVRAAQDLELLMKERPDLKDSPEVMQLIVKFMQDLQHVQSLLDQVIKLPKGAQGFSLAGQWWDAADIRFELERIHKDIEDSYRRLMAGGVIRVALDVKHVQTSVDSIRGDVRHLVNTLAGNPRRADEFKDFSLPSLEKLHIETSPVRAALSSAQYEDLSLAEKVEFLEGELLHAARRVFPSARHIQQRRESDPSNSPIFSPHRTMLGDPSHKHETAEIIRLTRDLRHISAPMTTDQVGLSIRRLNHSLNNLTWREQAPKITDWETKMGRLHIRDQRVVFARTLAEFLFHLSDRLSDAGRKEEALEVIEEVVLIYRTLIRENSETFRPYLAASLFDLAACLHSVSGADDALGAIGEAVRMYRKLTQQLPTTFQPYLTKSIEAMNYYSNLAGPEDD